MNERPILMSGPMVRAILAGTKTQTRRVVKGDWTHTYPAMSGGVPGVYLLDGYGTFPGRHLRCPYGQPGDRLWVRETWADPSGLRIPAYAADKATAYQNLKWRPSIHMPRWASRLLLDVRAVRAERIQDISEEDAIAEGVWKTASGYWNYGDEYNADYTSARDAFFGLWDSTYAARGLGVDFNPWAWAIEFERAQP